MNNLPSKRWQPGDVAVLRYVETPASARIVHAYMGDPAGGGGGQNGQPFLVGGQVVTAQARPYLVIKDTGDSVALFQPRGTPLRRWLIAEQRYLPDPSPSAGESIRLLFPGRPYDVTLFFDRDGDPPWFYAGLFDGDGLQAGWRERRRTSAENASHETPRPANGGGFRGWYVNVQTTLRRPYGFDVVDNVLDIVVRPDRTWYWKDEDELALALATGACTPEEAARIREGAREVIPLIEAHASPFDNEWQDWRAPVGWAIEQIPDGWQSAPALISGEGSTSGLER